MAELKRASQQDMQNLLKSMKSGDESKKTVQNSIIGVPGINAGFVGVILAVEWLRLSTAPDLTRDQVVGEFIIAKAGDKPWGMGFKFEGGRELPITALTRSALSTVNGTNAQEMLMGDFFEFEGKTLTCVEAAPDESDSAQPIIINRTTGEKRFPRKYVVEIA